MPPSEPLSVRQLEVFVALIDHRSFTLAAKQLSLSQSTVSGHIADLERRLGVRLVERNRGGALPTAAGKALLRPAMEALRAELNARRAIADLTGLLTGVLAVGGSTIPACYLLPAMFGRFRSVHPGVSLRLVTGDSRDILERVASGNVELGVVGQRPRDPALAHGTVGRDELILIAPQDHPFGSGKPVAVHDLVAEPLVLRERGSGTRAATEKALASALGKRDPVDLSVACEVGSTEAMKAAVRAGIAPALISDLAVQDEIEAGTLIRVPVQGLEATREFHLVSRGEEYLSPAARAFLAEGRPQRRRGAE